MAHFVDIRDVSLRYGGEAGGLVALTHLRVGLLFVALGAWFIVQARSEATGRRGARP